MTNAADTPLPLDLCLSIDGACARFEQAWKHGQRPAPQDFLGAVPESGRAALLAELIRTELEWRCRHGEQPDAQEYRTRFPDHAGSIDAWLAEALTAVQQLAGDTAPDDPGTAAATQTFLPEAGRAAVAGPRVLGEYELLDRLAAGGMGEVYRARHRQLDKLVALKVLPARALDSPERVARFRREMKAIGRLDHPNLVEAHDAGEQSGVVYLAMKLIDGVDLQALVRQRGPLPVGEACELVRQAAVGLQYLHEHGMVHRDVKPSNLMRTPQGVVKVLDLGLARWRAVEEGGEDLTAAGAVMGTPDYLAPEQVRSGAVDARADLYGLGGTLFYLLTTKAPFTHRQGMYEKFKAHEQEAAPDVRSLRPEVPAELAALVARLLAKEPQDRPSTAGEVAAALAPFAEPGSAAVAASKGGPPTPAPRPARRPRVAALRAQLGPVGCSLSATLAVVLVGVALTALVMSTRQEQRVLVDSGMPPPQPAAPTEHEVTQPPRDREKLKAPLVNPPPGLAPVRVLSLEVVHYANVGGRGDRPVGVLGQKSFAARRDDSVVVRARLSRQVYAYLIAFRPDGTDEVCFPEKADQQPPATDRPAYPFESQDVNYGLNEGEGLQVFAVVASSRPLPPYKAWRARRGALPWGKYATAEGVVWWDDGTELLPLTADDPLGQRGQGQEIQGKTPLARLTAWLRQAPEVEAVAAVGFAVLPKAKP
jgi:tRNA A-37 threonylcarbamoyl transferase component Bud32